MKSRILTSVSILNLLSLKIKYYKEEKKDKSEGSEDD